jgi:carboxyl-terminal processing protease
MPDRSKEPDVLSADERIEGFVRLWSEIKYNFAFFDRLPDLNWEKVLTEYLPQVRKNQSNQEYIRLLSRCMSELHDSHSMVLQMIQGEGVRFTVPLYPEYAPPLCVHPVEGKAIIVEFIETEEINRARLRRGMEITHIDERPVKEVLEQELYPYLFASTPQARDAWSYPMLLNGPPGTKVQLKIRNLDNTVKTVTLTREPVDATFAAVFPKPYLGTLISLLRTEYSVFFPQGQKLPWEYRPARKPRELPDGIIYVPIDSFASDEIVKHFNALFEQISHAKGLILDVRENGGGNSDTAYAIISYLTDRPLKASQWKTRQHMPSFYARRQKDEWYKGGPEIVQPIKGKKPYLGPVVVLIGPGTYSAAEDFLIPLHQSHRATLVGQRTNGSTGQPIIINLPASGMASICTKWDTYSDGREFIGVGVIPDVEVYPTQEEIAAGLWSGGKDPILEKGLEVLRANQFS